MTKHVVVIGAGAVGLMTAYQLVADGAQVTLVDTRATGRGAAEVNAGWVVPAECAPVPGPGMISQSLKWMLRKDSPLYIRPSLDPQFARFMIGMWRSCNTTAQRAGFEAHLRLAQYADEGYERYRADDLDFELRQDGLLMAFTDTHNLDHHRANLDIVERFSLDPQVLLGDAVREQEPALADAVQGGIFFPHERHLDPPALMRALHRRLDELGADLVEHAPVERVEKDGDRVHAVVAGEQRFTGDAFVIATGAWTGRTSRLFGTTLPVRPGKGYSVDVEPFALRSSVNLSDAKVAVTPLTRNLRLAGTMEFGGLDEELNQVRVDAILRAPQRYFRDWRPPAGPITPVAGMRPMTPDGKPVLGRLGEFTNAFVSSGHGMQGLTMGPGSARAISELVLTGHEPDVLAPFAPSRFTTSAIRSPRTSSRKVSA